MKPQLKYFSQLVLVALGLSYFPTVSAVAKQAITVYTAKKIHTMDASVPEAKVVAVADGRIVTVGTMELIQPWLKDRKYTIDRSFENYIMMPGFIDPHVHPSLPAVLTQFPFLAPDDWHLPTGDFPGATTPEDYKIKLNRRLEL